MSRRRVHARALKQDASRTLHRNRDRYKKTGKRNFYWKDRLTPPMTSKGAPYVLIPGEYPVLLDEDGFYIENEKDRDSQAYYEFLIHNIRLGEKKFRSFVCSAGPDPHNPKDCLGCYYAETGGKKSKGMAARPQFAFNAIELTWWHKVPVLNDDGTQMYYSGGENEGQPVFNDEPCKGKKCEFCEEDYERYFGRRGFLQLGIGHWERLNGHELTLSSQCKNCGSHELEMDKLICSKCGKAYMDVSERDEKEIMEELGRSFKCRHCKHVGTPEIEYYCPSCDSPEPMALYYNVVYLKRDDSGNFTTLDMVNAVAEEDFQMPKGSGYKNLSQLIDDLYNPYDFANMFTPDSLEEQADVMDRPIPRELRKSSTGSSRSRSYEEDEDSDEDVDYSRKATKRRQEDDEDEDESLPAPEEEYESSDSDEDDEGADEIPRRRRRRR